MIKAFYTKAYKVAFFQELRLRHLKFQIPTACGPHGVG